MVATGKARIFMRKDGKYLVYLPKDLCEDSMFPIKLTEQKPSVKVDASFSETAIILRL